MKPKQISKLHNNMQLWLLMNAVVVVIVLNITKNRRQQLMNRFQHRHPLFFINSSVYTVSAVLHFQNKDANKKGKKKVVQVFFYYFDAKIVLIY